MANRTLTAAGGNWNVAATWVENAVPTTSDDIFLLATSGPLTIPSGTGLAVNGFYAGSYSNTIDMRGNIQTGGTGTVSCSTNMKILFNNSSGNTWTFFNTPPGTIAFGGLTLSCNVSFANGNRFSQDLHVVKNPSYSTTMNYGNGNANSSTAGGRKTIFLYAVNGSGQWGNGDLIWHWKTGTCSITMDYSMSANTAGTTASALVDVGSDNTVTYQQIGLLQNATFQHISGKIASGVKQVYYGNPFSYSSQAQNNLLDVPTLFNDVFVVSNFNGNNTYTFGSTLSTINMYVFNQGNNVVMTNVPTFNFRGAGISASNFYTLSDPKSNGFDRTNSPCVTKSNINLQSGQTYTFDQCFSSFFSAAKNCIWSASTASSAANINILGTSSFMYSNFVDINATGKTIYAINGTVSRTTGITTSFPTGGGGGVAGGSFTFLT